MSNKINKIIVLGGGSAGWMTAATLIKFFPNIETTVIESPNVPIVGVGESTLGAIRNWTTFLEIDEKDFMKYTNASYKLSIKFTDFFKKDAGHFHYPFSAPVLLGNDVLSDWQAKRAVYPDTPVTDYCDRFFSIMQLVNNNKFSRNEDGYLDNYDPDRHSAYHFDATLFGQWLKNNYCLPRGVKHIGKEVTDVKVSDIGIDSLCLDDGTTVSADLFIDCTGWKSMLLGEALKEPFDSWEDILPNNRAWATQLPYVDKEKELEPYTNCTAIGNGWVWNIPLWSRLGTGYVYSDRYTSKEDALEEFKNHLMSDKMTVPRTRDQVDQLTFKDISMRVGIHKRTWVKNVVAIGLSAGFIEPLESNGLFTVHEFLLLLTRVLERGHGTQWDRDTYNTATREIYENFAEFVALHYAMSVRDDTKYWKDITERCFSPDMVKRIPSLNKGFADLVNRKMFLFSHSHDPGGIHCIATGMHYFVFDKANVMYAEKVLKINLKKHLEDVDKVYSDLKTKWIEAAERAPSLFNYLKENIHYE